MRRKSGDDPIIYFTLIDFLLQLVFLGIFAFVVSKALARDDHAGVPNWVYEPQYLPLLNDTLSPFIRADEADKLRGLLEGLREKPGLLDKFLEFLATHPRPLELLNQCSADPATCTAVLSRCSTQKQSCANLATMSDEEFSRILGGSGKPFCRKTEGRRALFLVTGFEDEAKRRVLRISEISDFAREPLTLQGIRLTEGTVFSPESFEKFFAPLERLPCAHVIRYRALSDSYTLSQSLRAFSVAVVK
jgi:hypothetical protein